LDLDERQKLYESMVVWYFHTGGGIFLPAASRNLFVAVRSNLVCPIQSLKPAPLAEELGGLSEPDAERRRGCVVIHQASLLRTQLKSDLDLHFGFGYYSALRADDRAFLKSCGISLWHKPWRRSIFPSTDGQNLTHACAVLASRSVRRRQRAPRHLTADPDGWSIVASHDRQGP
jgi:hypothetical protein